MYLSDASKVPQRKPGRRRTVVIGAGAIGLYAASLLAKRGQDVVVLEAGDSQLGRFAPESYTSVGRPHGGIQLGRARNLGGTTSLWGGQLVEFQPIDFAPREWIPSPRWPVGYEELAPYYAPTYENLGIPPQMVSDGNVWKGLGTKPADLGADFEVFFTRWMPIPNFAQLCARQIQSDENLIVLAEHAAAGFRGEGSAVQAVRVVDRQGGTHWIEGDTFLLAAGTIENARLLLHSGQDAAWPAPWRGNDNVGRYFQDHLGGRFGSIQPADKKAFFRAFANAVLGGYKFQPKIRMKGEAQRRERIYNVQGIFSFESEVSEHLVFLKQFLRAALYSRKLTGIGDVFRKGAGAIRFLIPLMWKYVWEHRVFVPSGARTFLGAQVEQASLRDSRITVDYSATDSIGLPRAVLDWRIHGDELASIREFAIEAREVLRASGMGELKIDEDLLALNPAFLNKMGDTYHMAGGAIMGASAEEAVVDRDLRVFGTENLYVGGASVFPTASNANVTFTALAFITRWAEHVAGAKPGADERSRAEAVAS